MIIALMLIGGIMLPVLDTRKAGRERRKETRHELALSQEAVEKGFTIAVATR